MSIYLSYSSISDFIRCSQKVLYRVTKPFPEIPSADMVMGKIVHSVLETSWNNDKEAVAKATEMCNRENLNGNQSVKVLQCIYTYFTKFSWMATENDKIEYTFKTPLYDDVFLVGKMDRIINNNLIDWKTGRVSKNLSTSIQCIIYDYAYEKIFGKPATNISMVSLSDGIMTSYIKNEAHVREVFDNVIPRMLKVMRNNTYEKLGLFNGSCFRCSWKQGCLGEQNVVDSSTSFIE